MPTDCHSITQLKSVIERNRGGERVGSYAVCSAHPWVLESAIRQAVDDGWFLHIESTSSQVNQFGGYSGQTPRQFAETVCHAAERAGLPASRILLGGDHLGPYPWRGEPANAALEKACELVRQCVMAGYGKIHLDASMACAGDPSALEESTVAERAALLCAAAEGAFGELPAGSPAPLYVIGTEVPTPGGEVGPGQRPAVTAPADVERTLEIFEQAFRRRQLIPAWDRIIGLVVQPGVEFGDDLVWNYMPDNTRRLANSLPANPALVYEAHSTDYQEPEALARMVEDHFAILKVGPWLTFAFREGVFALSDIERELFASQSGAWVSRVREELEAAMLRNPVHWRTYYHGDAAALARAFSLSDRCRYYWPDAAIQRELQQLLCNLGGRAIPLGLLSQYLPAEYAAIRAGQLTNEPHALIQHHIRAVLTIYSAACGANRGCNQTD